MRIGILVAVALTLTACSSSELKRGAYQTLQNKQCYDERGTPNCGRDATSYEEYARQRETVIRQE